jgi:outer membrane protein TolC
VKAAPLLLLLVAAASWPSAAAAQGPAPPPLALPSSLTSFLGGVPEGTRTDAVVKITVLDAIGRALRHNLGVLLADDALGRAQGTRWRAMSELLPNVNGRVSETRQKINLAAFGFGGTGGPSFPGIPTVVGPFNVFDARVMLSQSIVDIQKINDLRTESHNVEAARLSYSSARDIVINVTGNYYIAALMAAARADAAKAQQQTAQALYTQAQDLKQGGLIAGIDVLRAEVQLNVERQRVTTTANELEKAKLALARLIGLPLGQEFSLDEQLPEVPVPDMSLEAAADQAFRTRADYQAAVERVHAAESARRAVVGEALPSVKVNTDYGEIGLTVGDALGTYSVSGVLNIPIFQGGRLRGRLLEADAELRRRRAEADDLKASIYYEVKTAFLDLQTTTQQLEVARKARDLSTQQLTQARDRFAAGVASNIEVVQAQEAVALAVQQFITATYGYDLAKGALIRGVGSTEATLKQLLGGPR